MYRLEALQVPLSNKTICGAREMPLQYTHTLKKTTTTTTIPSLLEIKDSERFRLPICPEQTLSIQRMVGFCASDYIP